MGYYAVVFCCLFVYCCPFCSRLAIFRQPGVSWLKLTSAEARHAGRYRCRAEFLDSNINCLRVYSNDAVFKVTGGFGLGREGARACCDPVVMAGPPVISLSNTSFAIETSQILNISGTISGYPSPSVRILQEVEGAFVESVDERFTSLFDDRSSRFTISINGTTRRDMGTYMIKATNEFDFDVEEFTVMVTGERELSEESGVWALCCACREHFAAMRQALGVSLYS